MEGFVKSRNLKKEELFIKNIKGEDFYFCNIKTPAQKFSNVIKDDLPLIISSYIWDKSMIWGSYENIRWIRPLRSIIAMIDKDIIEFNYHHIKSGNITKSHRYMKDNQDITILDAAEYENILENNGMVIVNHAKRKELIKSQINHICIDKKIQLLEDNDLLEEVIGLVEYPIVLFGEIPNKFLKLPKEVLITSMKKHQKYFSTINENNLLNKYFIFVSNIKTNDTKNIIKGNEKVLNARLSDALYFYEQDLKNSSKIAISSELKKVIFHNKIGSLYEKVSRINQISKIYLDYLGNNNINLSKGNVKNHIINKQSILDASLICKNDITSHMVDEFPNLQGIMEYYYSLKNNIPEETSILIKEHYKPLRANDSLPQNINSAILSMADKIDNICALFLADEQPSSSKDPFALRRCVISIIRIIEYFKLPFDIKKIVSMIKDLYVKDQYIINKISNIEKIYENISIEISLFFEERLKYYLKTKNKINNYDVNLINSAVNFDKDSNILNNIIKNSYIQNIVTNSTKDKNYKESTLISMIVRIDNILKNNQDKARFNITQFEKIKNILIKSKCEEDIINKTNITYEILKSLLENEEKDNNESNSYEEKFNKLMINMIKISELSTSFFANNLIIDETDKDLSNNRLKILSNIKYIYDRLYNFQHITS
ncbi:MAG TPA: glycine--tRNA ligase subunit beta [Candidatus Megaira endosymbiont of Hartmannula sinica]|nr:glycine--tRNA ligase subunit beta [Candidatus Megaera endosymbiont of Hartmannula sinica]